MKDLHVLLEVRGNCYTALDAGSRITHPSYAWLLDCFAERLCHSPVSSLSRMCATASPCLEGVAFMPLHLRLSIDGGRWNPEGAHRVETHDNMIAAWLAALESSCC